MTKITLDELMGEIDVLISEAKIRPAPLTEDQYRCIKVAREADNPVTWRRLAQWWKDRGWGEIRVNTLKSRYYDYRIGKGDK